ncbi:MAG TPA: pyridoxamine 5'-phosphate oxidase [Jiangellaceae bacterium]|nr:pyridoxamine 5'-phosphate oxidase [Jiangellaceae bacterium]
MTDGLASMRMHYPAGRLLESEAPAEPVGQFRAWLAAAIAAGLPEPNAMVLATATPDGRPSARHVLLKAVDDTGFVFFTNLASRKATELAANSAVALCFPWFAMARQVVVNGTATPISRSAVAEYWVSRPRDSQLGAWASRQSAVIGSRDDLEAAATAAARRFPGPVPLPEFWGGYRVEPDEVEFWQGAPGRLHDRLRYTRTENGWLLERLAP